MYLVISKFVQPDCILHHPRYDEIYVLPSQWCKKMDNFYSRALMKRRYRSTPLAKLGNRMSDWSYSCHVVSGANGQDVWLGILLSDLLSLFSFIKL